MKEVLKLVSLNIEQDEHLPKVENFLKKETPDVVCFQEVYERDLVDFAQKFRMNYAFGQMCNARAKNSPKDSFLPFGLGIMSALPMDEARRIYYRGNEEAASKYKLILEPNGSQEIPKLILLSHFIATTHFTWSPDGKADNIQREDLEKLLAVLSDIPEFVLCGDFNAPRGREIFEKLASLYKDSIPRHYTTSLDYRLHRAGESLKGRKLMVDGLFTTPQYECHNVRLVDGVSDHMAIVAEVIKR